MKGLVYFYANVFIICITNTAATTDAFDASFQLRIKRENDFAKTGSNIIQEGILLLCRNILNPYIYIAWLSFLEVRKHTIPQ